MQYLSLDIETTGLNPDTCQILQLAAVLDDTTKPLEAAPTFNALVYDNLYAGEPYALAMNQEIFSTLAKHKPSDRDVVHRGHPVYILPISTLLIELQHWLEMECCPKPVVAGKNVANFDLRFIEKLGKFNCDHRCLDPGNLYLQPSDQVVPGTAECLRRAGLPELVSHDALDDAYDVCKLIRHWEANY